MSEGNNEPVLKTGELAYFISVFHGCVPCKVLHVGFGISKVKFTANRGAYHKGDIDTVPTFALAPRDACRLTRFGKLRVATYRTEYTEAVKV